MIYLTYAMPEEAPRCPLPTGCEVVLTGIGKALAMSQLAKALLRAQADMVISVGFCGGLNGTPQGAMVMPDRTLQWDLFPWTTSGRVGRGTVTRCWRRWISARAIFRPRSGREVFSCHFLGDRVWGA